MKKVSELEGAELDYWVARALGYKVSKNPYDGLWCFCDLGVEKYCHILNQWQYFGPIIEREKISITFVIGDSPPFPVIARISGDIYAFGPTPLIAAMRCLVASKFGEEVEETTS